MENSIIKKEKNYEYDISIIIPIYNSENFLEECINSVVNQENVSLEIILVNDGSNDNSGNIIEKYADTYNNIVSLHQPNSGVSKARNSGIDIAKGEYIGFLDSDDYMVEGQLYEALNICRENNLDLLFSTFENFFNDNYTAEKWKKKKTGKSMRNAIYEPLVTDGFTCVANLKKNGDYNVNVPTQIIKRAILKKHNIRFVTGIFYEDAPYTLDILFHSKRVMCSNNIFYMRRIRDNSVEHRASDYKKVYYLYKGLLHMIKSVEEFDGVLDSVAVGVIEDEINRRARYIVNNYYKIDEKLSFQKKLPISEKIAFNALISVYFSQVEKNKKLKNNIKVLEHDLNEQINETKERENLLKEQQQKIKKILNSKTFKVVNFIMSPFRKLKKYFTT